MLAVGMLPGIALPHTTIDEGKGSVLHPLATVRHRRHQHLELEQKRSNDAEAVRAACEALPSQGEWSSSVVADALKGVKVAFERAPAPRKHDQSIAVVLRGDMRGTEDETRKCAQSVVSSFIEPCERGNGPTGCDVDVFGVAYAGIEDEQRMRAVTEPFGEHLAQLVTMPRESQQTAIVGGIQSVLDYAAKHDGAAAADSANATMQATTSEPAPATDAPPTALATTAAKAEVPYTTIVVARWDLYFKPDFPGLLRGQQLLGPDATPGVGILWHEVQVVDWRQDPSGTFPTNSAELAEFQRVPDAVSSFSGELAQCFMAMVKTLAPGALGHDIVKTSGAASEPLVRYLLPHDVYDSNPLRCMLNPIYDMLPRNNKLVEADLCQKQEDFVVDSASGSQCCPAPGYCCPHTSKSCEGAGVTKYEGELADCGQ